MITEDFEQLALDDEWSGQDMEKKKITLLRILDVSGDKMITEISRGMIEI